MRGIQALITRYALKPGDCVWVDTGSYEADFDRVVAEADLIFEAVTEQLPLKKEFFDRIDAVRRPDSIVATVTSGLSIDSLAKGRGDSFRQNFLGLHFFNPVHRMPLVEVVRGPATRPDVVAAAAAFAVQVGKGIERLENVLPELLELALGGTAVGTGINAPEGFAAGTIEIMSQRSGYAFREAENHFEAQAAKAKNQPPKKPSQKPIPVLAKSIS